MNFSNVRKSTLLQILNEAGRKAARLRFAKSENQPAMEPNDAAIGPTAQPSAFITTQLADRSPTAQISAIAPVSDSMSHLAKVTTTKAKSSQRKARLGCSALDLQRHVMQMQNGSQSKVENSLTSADVQATQAVIDDSGSSVVISPTNALDSKTQAPAAQQTAPASTVESSPTNFARASLLDRCSSTPSLERCRPPLLSVSAEAQGEALRRPLSPSRLPRVTPHIPAIRLQHLTSLPPPPPHSFVKALRLSTSAHTLNASADGGDNASNDCNLAGGNSTGSSGKDNCNGVRKPAAMRWLHAIAQNRCATAPLAERTGVAERLGQLSNQTELFEKDLKHSLVRDLELARRHLDEMTVAIARREEALLRKHTEITVLDYQMATYESDVNAQQRYLDGLNAQAEELTRQRSSVTLDAMQLQQSLASVQKEVLAARRQRDELKNELQTAMRLEKQQQNTVLTNATQLMEEESAAAKLQQRHTSESAAMREQLEAMLSAVDKGILLEERRQKHFAESKRTFSRARLAPTSSTSTTLCETGRR